MKLLSPKEHSEQVNRFFNMLAQDVRQEITKDDLAEYLDSEIPQFEQEFQKAIQEGAININVFLLKSAVRLKVKHKLSNLSKLVLVTPRDIDVMIAQMLFHKEYKLPRALDPSSYATNGVMQSYETLSSKALFSMRSIGELQGDSVHFMMFATGRTKIECNRFSFGNNPLFSLQPGDREGDPCLIDEAFCGLLNIQNDGLMNHALRLEMIQNILREENFQELEVQALFSHWLGELVRQLDGDDSNLRVTDVTGMTTLRVQVEVCNEYLALQGRVVDSIESSQLSIEGDLAVCDISLQGNARDAFVYSSYNVEMKQALKLRHSALGCKSQLLAESLARSIYRLTDLEPPEVLYSMLCDGLCLHVLVHFPKRKVAYLSHREIEPGRITCVVAWLHKLSARKDLSEEEFLNMGFDIGLKMQDEVAASVKKKRERKPAGGDGTKNTGQSNKNINRKVAPRSKTRCIDLAADEEAERRREDQSQFSAFLQMQNYYRYGDPMPLTEAILDKSTKIGDHEQLSLDEKLSRAGYIS